MSEEAALSTALFVHVPVVVAWICFAVLEAALVSVPGFDAGQRARVVRALRWPTIVLVLVISATGVRQTIYNPFQTVDSWAALQELKNTTVYGMALFWKHVWVVITFALSLWLRFSLGTRPEGGRLLTVVVWLNVAACLLALVATTRMTIQLH